MYRFLHPVPAGRPPPGGGAMKLHGKAKQRARRQAQARRGSDVVTCSATEKASKPPLLGFLSPQDWNVYRRWLGTDETGEPLPVATCLRVYRETAHDPTGPAGAGRRSTLADDDLDTIVTMALSFYDEIPEVAALLTLEDDEGRCPCLRCAEERQP